MTLIYVFAEALAYTLRIYGRMAYLGAGIGILILIIAIFNGDVESENVPMILDMAAVIVAFAVLGPMASKLFEKMIPRLWKERYKAVSASLELHHKAGRNRDLEAERHLENILRMERKLSTYWDGFPYFLILLLGPPLMLNSWLYAQDAPGLLIFVVAFGIAYLWVLSVIARRYKELDRLCPTLPYVPEAAPEKIRPQQQRAEKPSGFRPDPPRLESTARGSAPPSSRRQPESGIDRALAFFAKHFDPATGSYGNRSVRARLYEWLEAEFLQERTAQSYRSVLVALKGQLHSDKAADLPLTRKEADEVFKYFYPLLEAELATLR